MSVRLTLKIPRLQRQWGSDPYSHFAHGGSREEEILKLLRRIDRRLARLVAG